MTTADVNQGLVRYVMDDSVDDVDGATRDRFMFDVSDSASNTPVRGNSFIIR